MGFFLILTIIAAIIYIVTGSLLACCIGVVLGIIGLIVGYYSERPGG